MTLLHVEHGCQQLNRKKVLTVLKDREMKLYDSSVHQFIISHVLKFLTVNSKTRMNVNAMDTIHYAQTSSASEKLEQTCIG